MVGNRDQESVSVRERGPDFPEPFLQFGALGRPYLTPWENCVLHPRTNGGRGIECRSFDQALPC